MYATSKSYEITQKFWNIPSLPPAEFWLLRERLDACNMLLEDELFSDGGPSGEDNTAVINLENWVQSWTRCDYWQILGFR